MHRPLKNRLYHIIITSISSIVFTHSRGFYIILAILIEGDNVSKKSSRNYSPNHMEIDWHNFAGENADISIIEASLSEKASLVGRVGLMLLECGTGAWRIRQSMNSMSEQMGIICTADIGLVSIDFTCFDKTDSFSQSLCLVNTGVNTSKLNELEQWVNDFNTKGKFLSGEELQKSLDKIESEHGLYSPKKLGLAAALACGAFTFLLGGGVVEMIGAFLGAGCGNFLRTKLTKHHLTMFLCIVSSVLLSCFVYAFFIKLLENILLVNTSHEKGYICAMLFIIPGFPFITSGLDLAKVDMRSGVERLSYSVMIIIVAASTAWIAALLFKLEPVSFLELNIPFFLLLLFRIIASFCGVFGFSMMFNSSVRMAFLAASIGALANTLRLELVDYANMPAAAAALIGAFTAGVLASFQKNKFGYPRISITVPSIVIMVPGLYFYQGVYYLEMMNFSLAGEWLVRAILIIFALPMGLIFARILTDSSFRHCT